MPIEENVGLQIVLAASHDRANANPGRADAHGGGDQGIPRCEAPPPLGKRLGLEHASFCHSWTLQDGDVRLGFKQVDCAIGHGVIFEAMRYSPWCCKGGRPTFAQRLFDFFLMFKEVLATSASSPCWSLAKADVLDLSRILLRPASEGLQTPGRCARYKYIFELCDERHEFIPRVG